jgi:hypothetical protein
MMRDDVVINNVKIMDAVLVAGVTTGCRVVVASEGRTNLHFFLKYDNHKTFITNVKV